MFIVVVSRAEKPTIWGRCSRMAAMKSSGGTVTPRSITVKPAASSIIATIFLPMSCRSPCTVPTTTVPISSVFSATMSGFRTASAACMHFADIITSGRKYSSILKRRPTSAMPVAIGPAIRVRAVTSASSAGWMRPTVSSCSPSMMFHSISWNSSLISGGASFHRSVSRESSMSYCKSSMSKSCSVSMMRGMYPSSILVDQLSTASGFGRRLRLFFRSPVQGS